MPTRENTTSHDQQSWENPGSGAIRKLRFLIDQNHVTVQQVADKIDIAKKGLQDILDGASLPTESVLRKCAEFFGVTLDFVTGNDDAPPKRPAAKPGARTGRPGSGAVPRARAAGAPAGARPTARAGSPARPAKSARAGGALNVRALATRFQALVELMIEKGVISARDYHEKVQSVEGRRS